METKELINFIIFNKGRKWINTTANYTNDKNEKIFIKSKIFITPELKNIEEGTYIYNLPAIVELKENPFNGWGFDCFIYPEVNSKFIISQDEIQNTEIEEDTLPF
jgi:hypothetical protein